MKGVEAPPIGGLIRAIVIVLVVLFAGWLLLAWAVLKRPVLALPVAAFTGLVVLVGMHDAQHRLLGANDQVKAVTAGSSGRGLADTIRGAFVAYQHAAEDRRGLGADVGEAVVRLVDAMTAAGYSERQARTADVWALRDGIYRPGRGA